MGKARVGNIPILIIIFLSFIKNIVFKKQKKQLTLINDCLTSTSSWSIMVIIRA